MKAQTGNAGVELPRMLCILALDGLGACRLRSQSARTRPHDPSSSKDSRRLQSSRPKTENGGRGAVRGRGVHGAVALLVGAGPRPDLHRYGSRNSPSDPALQRRGIRAELGCRWRGTPRFGAPARACPYGTHMQSTQLGRDCIHTHRKGASVQPTPQDSASAAG